MIIQTGMRTDIPAFYSQWFLNRIKEEFVLVRNPYHPSQVTRYRLSPDVVDLIAFCTKNPTLMLPHLDALDAYGQYWFVTITPYGKEIEPYVPEKQKVIEAFQKLSERIGAECVGWRYDPIFIDETYSIPYHLEAFEKMAAALSGYTKCCVISFIDIYKKVERNFPSAREVSKQERLILGKELIRIAHKYGMVLKPCAEGTDLAPYGADCSGCMSVKTFETALHAHLDLPKRTNNQRKGQCACLLGADIGAYDTCAHMCKYCYANANAALVRENRKRHDPSSPFLIGTHMPEDVIHEAQQKSWIDRQLRLPIE